MHIQAGSKKTLLFGAVALLAVSTALATIAWLGDGLDPLWRQAQTSALALGVGCLMLLVFLQVLAHGEERSLAVGGFLLTPVAMAFNLYAIWTDAPTYSLAGKLMATATYPALGVVAVGLMALARLTVEWHKKFRSVAAGATSLMVGFVCYQVWVRPTSEWTILALQIMALLAVLSVVAVWILHCISNRSGNEAGGSSPSPS